MDLFLENDDKVVSKVVQLRRRFWRLKAHTGLSNLNFIDPVAGERKLIQGID